MKKVSRKKTFSELPYRVTLHIISLYTLQSVHYITFFDATTKKEKIPKAIETPYVYNREVKMFMEHKMPLVVFGRFTADFTRKIFPIFTSVSIPLWKFQQSFCDYRWDPGWNTGFRLLKFDDFFPSLPCKVFEYINFNDNGKYKKMRKFYNSYNYSLSKVGYQLVENHDRCGPLSYISKLKGINHLVNCQFRTVYEVGLVPEELTKLKFFVAYNGNYIGILNSTINRFKNLKSLTMNCQGAYHIICEEERQILLDIPSLEELRMTVFCNVSFKRLVKLKKLTLDFPMKMNEEHVKEISSMKDLEYLSVRMQHFPKNFPDIFENNKSLKFVQYTSLVNYSFEDFDDIKGMWDNEEYESDFLSQIFKFGTLFCDVKLTAIVVRNVNYTEHVEKYLKKLEKIQSLRDFVVINPRIITKEQLNAAVTKNFKLHMKFSDYLGDERDFTVSDIMEEEYY